METQSANGMTRWTAAECPFTIEYSTRVLDDVRLAVMDAFFSLPRGGAEIGGILLGRPGTAMPPWQGILNEADADWILAQLLAGFPQEIAR